MEKGGVGGFGNVLYVVRFGMYCDACTRVVAARWARDMRPLLTRAAVRDVLYGALRAMRHVPCGPAAADPHITSPCRNNPHEDG